LLNQFWKKDKVGGIGLLHYKTSNSYGNQDYLMLARGQTHTSREQNEKSQNLIQILPTGFWHWCKIMLEK
jgi:hypothetical protein